MLNEEDKTRLLAASEAKVAWAQRIGASFTEGQVSQMVQEVYHNVGRDYYNGHSGYGDGGGIDNYAGWQLVDTEIRRLVAFSKA